MRKTHDFVIIGAGTFGAWTAHHLRHAGFSVALIDAYGPANSRASSGGESRIIRMGYGRDELYTRWAAQSLPQWKELAVRTNQELFRKTGVLWLSTAGDPYLDAMRNVFARNAIRFSKLSEAEIRRNYLELGFENVEQGILEPDSGVLMARQAIQTLVDESLRAGVKYFPALVLPISNEAKLENITSTSGQSFSAGAFIFACGPWLPKLFPDLLRDRIRVTRQEVFFLGVPPGDDSFAIGHMPVWLHHSHPLRPYALPDIANRGFKIALDRHGAEFDPDRGSRLISENSVSELRSYLANNVPKLKDAPIVESRVCQYENTSNGDFLIDRHPESEKIWLVGGGSGHGFKHGPAVGEHVRDLLLNKAHVEPRFSLSTKQTTRMRAVF